MLGMKERRLQNNCWLWVGGQIVAEFDGIMVVPLWAGCLRPSVVDACIVSHDFLEPRRFTGRPVSVPPPVAGVADFIVHMCLIGRGPLLHAPLYFILVDDINYSAEPP